VIKQRVLRATSRSTLVMMRSTKESTTPPTTRETLDQTDGTRETRGFALSTRGCLTAKFNGCRSTPNARQHEDQQSVATQCWGASSHSTKTVSRNSTNPLCNNAIDEPIDNGANNTRNYRVNGKNERTRLSALTARGCPTVPITGHR
jgi:hypothetical protein